MISIRPEDRDGISHLAAAFAWNIDHRGGAGVSALFTPDGVYGYAGFEMHGTAAIDAFYAERLARGKRLSRHLFSVPHVICEQEGCFTAWSVLTLHASDGEPPFPPGPIAIMDYEDHIVKTAQGFRFARRWVTPLFGRMPQLVAAQKLDK